MSEGTLTIIGEPNADVRVIPRDRGDEPPPPFFEGPLGTDGVLTLSVPLATFVVLCPGCETGIAALTRDTPEVTVRLVRRAEV